MYSFRSRVRFSEIDSDGFIKFENIVNYMQDCSSFQSEDLGVGIEKMRSQNKTWMISSWYIEIIRYPKFGEQIEVITYPYSFDRIFGGRNFLIKDSKGEVVARADSKWVLVDTLKKKVLRIKDVDSSPYKLYDKIKMEFIPKRIIEPVYGEIVEKILVDKSYIDSNKHMNNEKYIELSMKYLPRKFKKFSSMRIDYKKSAVLGDNIFIKVGELEKSYVVCLCDEIGGKYALAEFLI